MSLRIGVDLDGVLAAMDARLAAEAATLFGNQRRRIRRLPGGDFFSTASKATIPDCEGSEGNLQLSARQNRQLWRHVESVEDFWERLDEIEPGAVQRLAAVAAHRRWQVIFLTKRCDTLGFPAQVQSQRWLESHGFILPSVCVVHGSRGLIASALDLDVVIDDRPENCRDVVMESRARAVLVWRQDKSLLPAGATRLGIQVVSSVEHCLDALTDEALASTRKGLGVKTGVMRLFGLKEAATA